VDEALELLDVVADAGLEGAVTWLVRLVGLLVLVGAVVALLVDLVGPLVAGGLALVGVVLLVAPSLLLALAEFA
jgi:hypothetical protein